MKFDDKFDIARPYTACFIILRKSGRVAMVVRKNTGWMDGYHGLPAGKGEWHETFTQTALREAKEEAGVIIAPTDLKMVHLAHRRTADATHFMDWVDVYFEADRWSGEPHNAEPEKSERLEWVDINHLPARIVPSQKAALDAIVKKERYSEYGWS